MSTVAERRWTERAQFKRHLNVWHMGALVVGCMIGWGCFVLPGDFLARAGPVGATIGIAVGTLLMIVIASSYGLMVAQYPLAGGEFVYAYVAAGRRHAFICGWFLTLGYLTIVPLNATALAVLGKFLFPGVFARGYLYSVAGFDVYLGEVLLASAAIVLFGWFNYRGVKAVGQTQLLMVLVMVGGVMLVAAGAALYTGSSPSNWQPLFAPGRPALAGVLGMVAIAPWMLSGFDTLPQAAEELAFSPTRSFQLMVLGIMTGALLYVTMVLATSWVMPWPQLLDRHPAWATGFAVEQTMGTGGLAVLTLAVLMGIFTGINGFFLAASRLMFSVSRATILPACFGKLHPQHGTPSNAIVFTAVVSLLAPWFGRQALLWIVDMSAVGIAIGYLYTCLGAWAVLARRRTMNDRRTFRAALAALGIAASAGFVVLLCVPGTPAFMAAPSWIALGGWVILGLIFYSSGARAYSRLTRQDLDYLVLGELKLVLGETAGETADSHATSKLTLDVTTNTDFSHIEAEVQQNRSEGTP